MLPKIDIQISDFIICFLAITIVFWTINIIFVYFQKFKTLRINHSIFFDEKEVSFKNIVQIKPYDFVQGRFEISAIRFIVNENGSIITYKVMAKPFTIFTKQSKTLDLLFKQFPELESKLAKDNI